MDALIGEAACKGAGPLVQLVLLHSVYGSAHLHYTLHTLLLLLLTLWTLWTPSVHFTVNFMAI